MKSFESVSFLGQYRISAKTNCLQKTNFLSIVHQGFQNVTINAINIDLNRVARIASTVPEEIQTTKQKVLSADYPPKFVNSVIRQFNEKYNGNIQDDCIIPPDFVDVLNIR